jgi:hypothetical protein
MKDDRRRHGQGAGEEERGQKIHAPVFERNLPVMAVLSSSSRRDAGRSLRHPAANAQLKWQQSGWQMGTRFGARASARVTVRTDHAADDPGASVQRRTLKRPEARAPDAASAGPVLIRLPLRFGCAHFVKSFPRHPCCERMRKEPCDDLATTTKQQKGSTQ